MTFLLFKFAVAQALLIAAVVVTDRHLQVRQRRAPLSFFLSMLGSIMLINGALVYLVTAYLNALPLATPVYYSRLWQIAHDASPDVVEIVSLTLTGGTPDVAITSQQVAKAGTIAIT